MDYDCEMQLHEEKEEEGLDYYYDSDSDDNSADSEEEDEKLQPYSVLTDHDIQKRQEEAIASVSAVLSIPSSEASILLRKSGWCVSRVNEEWFSDEVAVRKRVGLLININAQPEFISNHDEPLVKKRRVLQQCGICLEDIEDEKEMMATSDFCGHKFCKSCWAAYADAAIADGPSCLYLDCPAPSCKAAVRMEDLIFPVISEKQRAKYRRYLTRSYVECNRKVKWCPAPGCQFAIECESIADVHDIVCKCGHCFCWKCCEEHHKPVECATVAKWIQKNSAESENVTWILANSKPCPKCKRPIQKNDGCMHMTCTQPCGFQFCWLCLGDWAEHGKSTGGFFACNRYEAEKEQGKHKEEERSREMAKRTLEKYTHYYERWASNHKSQQKALMDLRNLQEYSILNRISLNLSNLSLSNFELKFISDMWLKIVECRRLLKWTYVYGYYLLDLDQNVAKKNLFEYLQGQAESALERLHECAEKDIKPFIAVEDLSQPPLQTNGSHSLWCFPQQHASTINPASLIKNGVDVQDVLKEHQHQLILWDLESKFQQFRTKLIDLTSITGTFFANLVKALENKLIDVEHISTSVASICTPSNSNVVKEIPHEYWSCRHCTYANHVSSTSSSRVCSMCRLSNLGSPSINSFYVMKCSSLHKPCSDGFSVVCLSCSI